MFSLSLTVTGAFAGVLPPSIDLNTDADILIYGPGNPRLAGSEVTVTDVNGDGHDDLVVGVCHGKGMVVVLWGNGSLTQTGAIDLASASPPSVSRILGKPSDNASLCSLSSGDFNADGYGDIIIGEPLGLFGRGKAYVVLGSASFPDTVDLMSAPANVIEIRGKQTTGLLGMAVCGCDLNGDGFDEIVVSAPVLDNGESYVIQGATSFQPTYDMSQSYAGVTRIADNNWNQDFGSSFACADFDSDGFEDLLIGSPGGDIVVNFAGIVTLIYGVPILPDTLQIADPAYRKKIVLPEYAHGQLGYRVSIGDVDGDGSLDGILSAYLGDPLGCTDCGELYIIFNMNATPDSFAVSNLSVPMTRLLGGGNTYDQYGVELHCDDVSGDGVDDVIIGSFVRLGLPANEQVVVTYGRPIMPDTVFLDTDSTVTRILGGAPGERLGLGVSTGDFNLDGQADVVLGAMFADPLGRPSAGTVYVVYGIPTLPITAQLDVKPGSCPNPLNASREPPNSISMKGGFLPLAVLGSETLDVTDVDISSLRLEDVPPVRYDFHDVAAPSENGGKCACPTAARDGYEDLILQFHKSEVADSIAPLHNGDVVELTLTGLLNDGTPIRGTGCVTIVGLPADPPSLGGLGGVVLRKPIPNPFNPTTRISYSLPKEGLVVLSIYDVAGRLVEHLVDEVQLAGEHAVEWNATEMSSGIYFCRMRAGNFTETLKLILLK